MTTMAAAPRRATAVRENRSVTTTMYAVAKTPRASQAVRDTTSPPGVQHEWQATAQER
jgi:hypothetical protein